jgi:hypothetical protein
VLAALLALTVAAASASAQSAHAAGGNSGLRTAQRALALAQKADARAGRGVAKGREALAKGKQALAKARQAMNKGRQATQIANAAQRKATRAQTDAADALATANRIAGDAAAALQAAQQAADDADAALAAAQQAADDAEAALAAAQQAQSDADLANDRLDAAEAATATEAGTVSTSSETEYVPLGGPEVTVTVPESGLIEVWATVRFEDPADGAVELFEDGQEVEVPGQEGLCGTPDLESALLSAQFGSGVALTLSTPPAFLVFGGCGSVGGAPGPVLFEREPGPHTYELRYANCGCDPGPAPFSNRTLIVAPRP